MHRPTPLSTLLPPHFPGQDLGIALEFLASHGISTDVEFLFGPEVLPPHRTLSPEFLALLRSLASSNLCASRTNGAEFLYRMVLPRRTSTSVPSLDRFLEGEGFPEGDLIELVGTPSSGRTVLSLYASLLYLLVNPARRAAYLDSKGNFDPFRCLAILKKVLIPRLRDRGHVFSAVKKGEEDGTGEAGTDDEVAMDVLDRISISRVTKSGQALDKIAEDQANETATKLGIVVIDQIDDLLGGEALTKKSAQGHANLIAFMRRLSSLAKSTTSPLTVLLINSLVPCSSTTPKPPPEYLASSNPQPPPLTSLPILSAVAPHGLANALSPASSESWPNLVNLSLVFVKSEDVFSARDAGGGGGGPRGGPPATARKKKLVSIIEIAKNSRGVGGTGQLIGIKLVSRRSLSQPSSRVRARELSPSWFVMREQEDGVHLEEM
ncbi:hypothetical protein JCM3766R1_005933 [Sporobolomyces carnicolor]